MMFAVWCVVFVVCCVSFVAVCCLLFGVFGVCWACVISRCVLLVVVLLFAVC